MDVKRNGSQPSGKRPAEWFTGKVRIDPLFQPNDLTRAIGSSVTFEPGARTAWHSHPLGQTLIVTSGCGLVQSWGSPVQRALPGDVVWFSPNEKHWHGATPTTAMTHISIVEQADGKAADWMEHVSDEEHLTLDDYAGTEKISDLPKRLSTEGAPAGSDPSVGDVAYYAPWGNLAIFYKDFGYSSGLVILGKIDSGIEVLQVPGSINVMIEVIE